jgi:molecular chaperone GrpE
MTEAVKKNIATPDENDPSLTEILSATGEEIAPETDPAEAQVKQQAEEIAQLKDQYLRAMAETENVRARARRDIEDTSKYASTKFARDVVNIAENLQRASASITPEARESNEVLRQVGDGIDMTMQELLAVFERNGIHRINPEGQKFDHNFHQAVAQVPGGTVPPGSVVQVLQAGYMLHDRLLKPAMVTIAMQANPSGAEPEA